MDDKRFLRDFELSNCSINKNMVDLKVLKSSSQSDANRNIFIFTHPNAARVFFLSPDYSATLSSADIFILPNEEVIPAHRFRPQDQVYLISASSEYSTGNDEGLMCTLHRIFLFDLWESLEKDNFGLPTIIVDDDRTSGILIGFLNDHFTRCQKFSENMRRVKQKREGACHTNALIYAIDNDTVLTALNEYLAKRGGKVFLVNNSTGWQPDSGYSAEGRKFMTDVEFAEYLTANEIGHVLFRNYYDMNSFDQINKIWIMKQLGIRAISLIVDTMIEFPYIRFGFMHWLADSVSVINSSSTESYDSFSKWMAPGMLCKAPQITEFSRMGNDMPESDEKSVPEGIIVTSNSRMMKVRENRRVALLLVPLVREILRKNMKIHIVYFSLIHAFMGADEFLSTEELTRFHFWGSNVTLVLRSLLRYALIQRTEKIAGELGIPFRIFGAKDWELLFPDSYVAKYLDQKELYRAYRSNIVLIPTPSTSFESQHPSIPQVLLLGGRTIAPAPSFAHVQNKTHEGEHASLRRFYFDTADEIEATLRGVMMNGAASPKEKTYLADMFGIDTLGNIVCSLMDAKKDRTWDKIPGAKEAISLMIDADKNAVAALSSYIWLLFYFFCRDCSVNDLLNNTEKHCSASLAQEVGQILHNRDGYIEKLAHENDIQAKVLNAALT